MVASEANFSRLGVTRRNPFQLRQLRFIVVLALTFGAIAQIDEEPVSLSRPRHVRSVHLNHAHRLYEAWTQAYNLYPGDRLPPLNLSEVLTRPKEAKSWLPEAPHLDRCQDLEAERIRLETRVEGGGLPDWARTDELNPEPRPPWIQGRDGDNLARTRQAQADIWQHQFPPDCRAPGLKFLIASWPPVKEHGLGSQLHVMGYTFSLAFRHGRILVMNPGSFERARHKGCSEATQGTFDCYFFPLVSPECERVALDTWHREGAEVPSRSKLQVELDSDKAVVWHGDWQAEQRMEGYAARTWGEPWKDRPVSFEEAGSVPSSHSDLHLMVNWWLSQAMRFLMRWPTAYLCHIMNRVRHEAYGVQVAIQVDNERTAQLAVLRSGGNGVVEMKEVARLLELQRADNPLEETLWKRGIGGNADQVYMPRPIVSVHVRQGDKSGEMQLASFGAYMWQVSRIRMHVPNLSHVWLSTEMQEIVDESQKHRAWKFLYSQVTRQQGTTRMVDYEASLGFEVLVGVSFANLLIASECDYFVGTLGSNWNRLINELRLTNGRLRSGYITLNEFSEV